MLAAPGVEHVTAGLLCVVEDKHFADLLGTVATQRRVRVHPFLEALSLDSETGEPVTMRTLAPPVGRGFEYLAGTGWDFEAELAEMPELLAEKRGAPSVEPGLYDLVVDPTNLWLTIHESVGHATELDRAMGYEAGLAGTSFATIDQLGTLAYGSELMNVTGDRTVPHGLATVAVDDEGVAGQSFDLVSEGILVGYQLDRGIAAEEGLGSFERLLLCFRQHVHADPANGERLPRPRTRRRPFASRSSSARSSAASTSSATAAGRSTCSASTSSSPGSVSSESRNGRLAGQLKDVAYQARTPDFWGAMKLVGGRVDLSPRGCVQLREGSTDAGRPGQPWLPGGAVQLDPRAQHARGGRAVTGGATASLGPLCRHRPRAGTRTRRAGSRRHGSGAGSEDGRIVIVEDSYEAELRFANNTATTNGVRRRRRITVVTVTEAGDGWTAGVASRSGSAAVDEVVEQSVADAAGALPTADAMALVEPSELGDELENGAGFEEPAEPTSHAALRPVLGGIGEMFERAEALSRVYAGFASHAMATKYLATSTGLRLRHVQPAGRLELSCRSADRLQSSWAGIGGSTFSDAFPRSSGGPDHPRPRLVPASPGAPGRPLRDDPPARRGRRPRHHAGGCGLGQARPKREGRSSPGATGGRGWARR